MRFEPCHVAQDRTIGINLPIEMWELLNRVAFERARCSGGRGSVSALLVQLVERHKREFETGVVFGQALKSMAANTTELEKRFWAATDQLRANSDLKSHEYSVPVLGPIFLCYADHKFTQAKAKFVSQGRGGAPPARPTTRRRGAIPARERPFFRRSWSFLKVRTTPRLWAPTM